MSIRRFLLGIIESVPRATFPDAPTGLTLTRPAIGQINASWTAPAFNGGDTITSYNVRYRIGAGAYTNIETGNTTTSILITGLANNTTYGVSVAARNSVGLGAYTAESSLSTLAVVPNIVGMTLANANTAITGAGLVVGSVNSVNTSNSAINNTVQAQGTASGTGVNPGTTINYTKWNYVAPPFFPPPPPPHFPYFNHRGG